MRSAPPPELQSLQARFHDARYRVLLQRYRARHHPDTLSAPERVHWDAFRRQRLTEAGALATLTLPDFFALIAQRRAEPGRSGSDQALLDQLEAWGRQLATEIDWNPGHA